MESHKDISNEEKTSLTVDEAIHKAGEFGKYQVILLLLLASTYLITSIPVFTMYFAAHNPPWQCISNTTCMLNGTYSPGSESYSARCSLPRDAWEYTLPQKYSLVTQFDLSCDKEWIINLLKSIIFVGWAFGAVACGAMADRFGRKKVLIASVILIFSSSLSMAFAPNVWLVVFLQAFRGFFRPGVSVSAFVLASEAVGHRFRPHSGISLFVSWTLALSLLGLKAYLIREWRKLILVCTLPYIPVLLAVFFIPESIRWLRIQGRDKDAVAILQKMARFNRKKLGKFQLESAADNESNTKTSYLDIFRPRKMLKQTIIQWFSWCCIALVYYGITFASDDLGGSMYRDYILSGLIELPAVIISIYLCKRFGRKPTVSYPMFVAAIVMGIVAFIPEKSDIKWLRVVFGMIGKFCISLSFDVVYTWSVELYPTSVRMVFTLS